MTPGTVNDPMIRSPLPNELPRVLHLFRNARLRASARLIVAERTHPIPRFVGAAAWWQEGAVGRFELACQPGQIKTDVLPGLIEAVSAAARQAGLETIQYAELLGDESVWLESLTAAGFERLRSERFFEIACRDAWRRIMRLYERHRGAIPATWRTDPIRAHPPEVIFELAMPHRLVPPEDLRHFWQASTAGGFDLDLSCILFEGERPFGTLLARHLADVLYVDVQIVKEPNPRLRSLGDLCMLYHDAQRVGPDGLSWVRFRSGETEHRQTANLALRMGGRELPRRHVWARRLKD
ncbi:MAG TPA: hypothetical protein VG167_21490 [Verrucomicrobiae bacterium]|nr:hypothetical protein [Verrucomicrobiae bacterium]